MDAREIEKCIDEFGTDIYRFCLKLCMDKSEAEDLYQQTFLKALEMEWTLDWGQNPKMLHADISCETVPDGASLTLWLVQGDVSKSFDVTNLSDPLEYSLSEFENGKIHVRLQINGVEDTISEIYVK